VLVPATLASGRATAWPASLWGLVGAAYLVVGLLIVERRAGNRVGPLAFALGTFTTLSVGLDAYINVTPGLPARELVAWIFSVADGPLFAGLAILVMIFPTGRLPSAPWRLVAWATALLGTMSAIAIGLRPGSMLYHETIDNPFGVITFPSFDLVGPIQLLFAAPVLIAMLSPLVRWRGAGQVERAQLKWIGVSGLTILGSIAFYAAFFGPTGYNPVGDLTVGLALATFPVAVGFAILRYRLFDIDRIISRTLAWSIVTVTIAALYLAGVLVLQTVLGQVTQGDTVAVAGSTLLAAAAFQPLLRRIQVAVDRRFDRSRIDAERAAIAFAGRLRDVVDLDIVIREVDETTRRALLPESMGVWLRDRNDLRTTIG